METGLNNSHIFITGASGGIGLITAQKFIEEGAKVSLHYNSNIEPLNVLLESYPERTCAVQANVKNELDVIAAINESTSLLGPINCIVINHGIWIVNEAPVVDMSLKQWQHTIDIDLTGSFLFAREYLKQLKDKELSNVSIIFIGSTAGIFGEARHADYAASKSALTYGLMRSLKNEIVLINKRGRVNTVAPGWVLTPMAEKSLEDTSIVEKVYKTMPLRKIATPDDVANSIVFLASEKLAGHLSGNIIEVTGGMEGRVLFD
ncbi:MAG: SDR family oxidoreductase [Candidatus Heimdallarchaeota archaeon]|nr:SDR family oxidoreductase [Candidatus Heimdallarchaeota archaeon]MDH5645686.1 SDR family oxidoreductase [Candidatus Heimdallarchaeota archaeon]